MKIDFDHVIPRRNSDSLKWNRYDSEVIPLWVADMDFRSPEPVLRVLRNRVDHGVFGYGQEAEELKEAVCGWLAERQGWAITPEMVVLLPGLVCGLNVVCRAIGQAGDGVLVNTPVYPPFLSAPSYQDRRLQVAELAASPSGNRLEYPLDLDALREKTTASTRLFIFCNPHNPTGRVYRRKELESVAEFCLDRDLILCSDEIHGDLILDPTVRHVAIASLGFDIAERTITLLAPSKTFNLPGLGCSMAVIPNPSLRSRILGAARGIVPEVNVFGMLAALAAYKEGGSWIAELLVYLRRNRDFLADYTARRWTGIRLTHPEATYLSWIDCRSLGLEQDAYQFFLEKAGVALNDGTRFGAGGRGFVRLNFGCPRATLERALERMTRALKGSSASLLD